MAKLLGFVMALLLIAGCSGVAQEDHDAVLDELEQVKQDFSALQSEYQSYKSETATFAQLTAAEQQAEVEIAKREDEIEQLEELKSQLEEDVSALSDQIDKLKADVIRISGEPRTYPAGYLTAGKDFPLGRYKIYGASSNFVVRSDAGSGRLRVNVTFGGRYGIDEYIYTFEADDEIQAQSSFKMVPVD